MQIEAEAVACEAALALLRLPRQGLSRTGASTSIPRRHKMIFSSTFPSSLLYLEVRQSKLDHQKNYKNPSQVVDIIYITPPAHSVHIILYESSKV